MTSSFFETYIQFIACFFLRVSLIKDSPETQHIAQNETLPKMCADIDFKAVSMSTAFTPDKMTV